MHIDFQIKGLDRDQFLPYFDMSESELGSAGVYLFQADKSPFYPCRVSLVDAEPGEQVLALSYRHLNVSSPYNATGPIFIRANAIECRPEVNEVPEMLRHRQLSVRGYSGAHRMIEADTAEGRQIETVLTRQFHNEHVKYIQIHNAGPGCFNCSVTRVWCDPVGAGPRPANCRTLNCHTA